MRLFSVKPQEATSVWDVCVPTGTKRKKEREHVTCDVQRGGRKMVCRKGGLETGIKGKGLVSAADADTRFEVFADAFLKEVCFALETNCLHPFEQVPNFEVTFAAQA